MQTLTHDKVSRYIGADPITLYGVVSDVTRTPELSPEIVSCEWLDGAGPVVGARFRARNRVHGRPSWANTPQVVTAQAGREFAFARRERIAGELVWRYRFEAKGSGTQVTESYEVTKPVPAAMMWIIRNIYGCKDRAGEMRAGMEETLARLAALSEGGPVSVPPDPGRPESQV